jgi:serine/threonine protein kinase
VDEEVLRSGDNGFDVILYIKMGLHPMTLEDYLWPDQQKIQQEDVRLYHCFHILPTASILISILDGLEYIHSKRIVHRDLKPSNIFLSQRPADPTVSLGGSIDTGKSL